MHIHPELSTQEKRTSELVAKELKAAGCEVTDHIGKYDQPGLTGYGVVGVMKNGDGPVVLVRTDMDALPVEEETGLPYASKVMAKNNAGEEVHVMHACGHDVHIATFIGVARAMAKLKDQWHGTILFVAQPAEEAFGGARALLNDGLYTRFPKPNFALGFHDKADLETNHIGVTPGYTYANCDSVNVTVLGVGGHGAYPHKTKDPIMLSAEMINMWQTIASREINPIDSVVVTVGSIHGGTKNNIIPNEVKMQLAVRTYKSEVREQRSGRDRADRKRLRGRGRLAGGQDAEGRGVEERVRALDLQQSRADETAGRCLETVVRREQRRDRRPDDGRRRFCRIQPAGPLDSRGRFSRRRGRSGKNRGRKKAGGAAAA